MGLVVTHTFVSPKSEQTDPTLVGPNEWNANHTITDKTKTLYNIDYNFTATPGGSLPVGATSFTLNTPTGFSSLANAGIIVGSSLYISGGIGTAETVTITNISGNVVYVTCANTHSGAWTVSSATSGIQEAINTVSISNGYSAAASVFVSTGIWPIYTTINIPGYTTLKGYGVNSTILEKCFTTTDLIYIGDSGSNLTGIGGVLKDFQIRMLTGVTDTGGYAIRVRLRYNPTIENVTIYGDAGVGYVYNGIKFDSCLTFSLINTKILLVNNIGLEVVGAGANQCTGRIFAVDVTSAKNSTSATNVLVYFHGNVLSTVIDGLQMQGGFYNWQILTTSGQFTESQISNIVFDSAAKNALNVGGTGSLFKVSFSNICLSTIAGASGPIGMVFDGTGATVFSDVTISGVTGGVNASGSIGTGIYIANATNFVISNSQIQGAGGGVGDTVIQIQGTTKNIIIVGNIIGYAYDGGTTGSQAYRAVYVPSGTHTNLLVANNNIYGSSSSISIAGAHTNLLVTNNNISGSIGWSGTGTAIFNLINPLPFASLPTAGSTLFGSHAIVSDATTNTFGATIAGSGADKVLAFCNGTNWTVCGA